MSTDLKEAFMSEFYISTKSIQPNCKLWHSLGVHICPEGISIFNLDTNKMNCDGIRINSVNDIKKVLKENGFKKVKQSECMEKHETWIIQADIFNYNKAIEIIEKYDMKMDPTTKKMVYW